MKRGMGNSKIKKYLFYPAANFGWTLLIQSVVTYYVFYYAPPQDNEFGLTTLIPMGLVGIVMLIGRIVDGIADPIVAYLSDNCKSPRGRRIPFLLYGALPLAITFVLIWFPINRHQSLLNFIYLSIVMSAFFFLFTVYVAPYLSLLPDIGKSSEERVKISTIKFIFNTIGLFVSAMMLMFAKSFGFKRTVITFAILATVSMYLPIEIKERYSYEGERVNKVNFLDSIRMTLRNKQFIYYLGSYLLVWFGFNMLTISLPYIGTVLLEMGDPTPAMILPMTVAVLSSPLIMSLVNKKGKKWGFKISMISFSVITLFIFPLGMDILFFNSSVYGMILLGLAGMPLAGLLIIPDAIVADITDYDALKTGVRREAMFFGVQGFVMKFVIALSSFFTTSILFNFFGYNKGDHFGINLAGLVTSVAMILGTVILKKFSLKEEDLKKLKSDKEIVAQ